MNSKGIISREGASVKVYILNESIYRYFWKGKTTLMERRLLVVRVRERGGFECQEGLLWLKLFHILIVLIVI